MVMQNVPGKMPGQADLDEELKKQIQKWMDAQAASLAYPDLLKSFKQQFPSADEKYLKDIAGAKGIAPLVPGKETAPVAPGVIQKPGLGPTWETQVGEKAYPGAPWGKTAEQEQLTEQERIRNEQKRITEEQLGAAQQLTPSQLGAAPGQVTQRPGELPAYTTTSEDTYLQGIKDLSEKLGTTVNFPAMDISQMSGQERRIYPWDAHRP